MSGLEELNTEHVSVKTKAGITFWNLIQNSLHKLVKYILANSKMESEIMLRKSFRTSFVVRCLKTGHGESGEMEWRQEMRGEVQHLIGHQSLAFCKRFTILSSLHSTQNIDIEVKPKQTQSTSQPSSELKSFVFRYQFFFSNI